MLQARAEWIRLTALGVSAFAPVAVSADHCHASHNLDPIDERFWTRWCAPFLAAARAVVVPRIVGWDTSVGVWREIVEAVGANKPVHVYAEAS